MRANKIKTYSDKLMQDPKFKKATEEEYQTLVLSEKITELRHRANLTQDQLAKKIHTTKSAISRYESNGYRGYSVFLLHKIASACGADLSISFVRRR